jgi:polyhydroxybutyrate depolymerase
MKFLNTLVFLSLLLNLSCKGGSSSPSDESSPQNEVTSSLQKDVSVSNWPHLTDIYHPTNATKAIIFLHGGGGRKHSVAYQLGIKSVNNATDSSYDSAFLINNAVTMVFPQGQANTGLGFTWNNYVMTSGQDDVAFLNDLVDYIKTTYPNILKVYLAGHSNGGMMAHRMWCESPQNFSAFAAFAGAPSEELYTGGSNPCSPTVTKPFYSMVGTADTVLQTSGQWNAATWTIDSSLVTGNFANPVLVADKVFYQNVKVTNRCGETPDTGTISGNLSVFQNCSGSIKLVRVTGADHCLSASGTCTNSLSSMSGLDLKTAMKDFFSQY